MSESMKDLREELEKLKKCCEWNGWNYKTTPAYKDIKKRMDAKEGKTE